MLCRYHHIFIIWSLRCLIYRLQSGWTYGILQGILPYGISDSKASHVGGSYGDMDETMACQSGTPFRTRTWIPSQCFQPAWAHSRANPKYRRQNEKYDEGAFTPKLSRSTDTCPNSETEEAVARFWGLIKYTHNIDIHTQAQYYCSSYTYICVFTALGYLTEISPYKI